MNIDDQVIIGIKLMCDNALRSHWDSDVMQTTLKNIRDLTASYIIVKEPEGGGVCQNCMGEGIDLIQSGKMVIKEKCTSCNGTGRSEGGRE